MSISQSVKKRLPIEDFERNQDKLKYLIESGNILSSSLDYRTTLKQISQLLVPKIADWCAIDVLDRKGNLERVSFNHKDSEKIELAYQIEKEFPTEKRTDQGVYKVLASGEYEYYPTIPDEMLKLGSKSERHYELIKSLGLYSAIIVPLKSRDMVIGAITLVQSESERIFTHEDLEYTLELAKRCSMAVENSMLYEQVKNYNITLEEKIKERTMQLENVNKELESFSYSVSHDLRSPLRHIEGFLKLLEKDLQSTLTEKSRRYMNVIYKASAKMNKLIEDLLNFSRLGGINLSAVKASMHSIVNDVLSEFQLDIQNKNIKVTVHNLHENKFDVSLMRLVWMNLISNAIKYSSKDRRLEIEIGSSKMDGEVVYFIKDNGIGFDNNHAEKIFGVFQRLHSEAEYAGTGIGLANIRRIISKHGGSIYAEGKLGEGSIFYFNIKEYDEGIEKDTAR